METLRCALAQKLTEAQLKNFDDSDLKLLVDKGYRNEAALEPAREADLVDTGLPTALIRILQKCGVLSAAGGGSEGTGGGPDTSQEYIRRVLFKPQPSGTTDVDLLNAPVGLLDQPLGAKLPVLGEHAQAALLSSRELQEYVVAQPLPELAASARELRFMMTAVLNGMCGFQPGGSETIISVKMSALVDQPLKLAAASLALDYQIDRNTADQSGATARKLRPNFLFWVSNVLLFKGEERANASELQNAIVGLKEKMATPWYPALLPGVSMPCMFAYAAAGNVVQFFAITSYGRAVEVAPISGRLDTSTPLGRIKVVHHTLMVLQALAAYAPHAPQISIALGGAIKAVGPGGNVLRSVLVFQDFVRKRDDLSQFEPGSVMDYPALVDMYGAIGRVHCPNLVRLHSSGIHGGGIRLQDDGTTLVLHLEPVGLPLYGPPGNEADLKQAVRDVLTGVAALHAAGFVHRDIRWPNVIRLPAASQSSPSSSPDTYVLIDLEHAARADCALDCRQPQFQLASWPDLSILDPATGRYTRESDLCMLAAELMSFLPFALSDSGKHLRQELAARQVTSAEAALQHAWLAAA